jgi:predicted metal-dependent phosphoesterase TrpH
MPIVKAELHSHTDADPEDRIGYSTQDLIDRALTLGYGALAITLHDRHFEPPRDLAADAVRRGLTLLPSIECTVEGRHVLLVNFPAESARATTFEAVRSLKRRHPDGLVVAPHPWFPLGKGLGPVLMERHADLWDAVEVNAFYTRLVDFNRRARTWAAARNVPLVGNGDVHRLEQLGHTYSLVDVDGLVTPTSLCAAIRGGRVRMGSRPLSHVRAARIALWAIGSHLARGHRT